MDSGTLLSFHHNGFKVLPTLYTDVSNIIISYVHASEESNILLNFALVCREWCQLTRRFSFAKLDNLTPPRLRALRTLLEANSGPSDRVSNEITFAKHVRRTVLYFNLETDSWPEAKEMIMLMDRSFMTNFKQTVRLTSGLLDPSHLLDLKACSRNITHLGLFSVQLSMQRDTLSEILCDESWPSLKDMSLERTLWKQDTSTNHTQEEGNQSEHTPRTLTLDHLHFLERQPYGWDYNRFWPHEGFDTLVVKTLILRVDIVAYSFWVGLPEMFSKIAANLIEVDAAHELSYCDFTQAAKNLKFPKLRTLKLRIMQDTGYFAGHGILLGDSEDGFSRLLDHMSLEALETLVVSIADAGDYITPGDPDKEGRPDFAGSGRLLDDPLYWDTVDEAISRLRPSTEGGATTSAAAGARITTVRPSRLSKVVFASWFEDWSKPNDEALRCYLRKKLPICTSRGLEVDFEILNYVDFD